LKFKSKERENDRAKKSLHHVIEKEVKGKDEKFSKIKSYRGREGCIKRTKLL